MVPSNPAPAPDRPMRVLIGCAIRKIRNEQGMSQEALARSMGMSREMVRAKENGRLGEGGPDMYVETLEKFAQALGMQGWELLRHAEAERDSATPPSVSGKPKFEMIAGKGVRGPGDGQVPLMVRTK